MASKKIFLACPIGDENSVERIRSDQLLKHVITPIVSELMSSSEDVLVRADRISEPGRITMQVLRELSAADVVIADLTGLNANVMYELGIRQALRRPYVLLAQSGQELPFDLSDFRTIFYVLDLDGVSKAQGELKPQLEKALAGQVSLVEQTIFALSSSTESTDQQEGRESQSLLAILEACNQILRESQNNKDLLVTVGQIALELRDAKRLEHEAQKEAQNQQMGMWIMQQFMQNPESLEKVMPAIQRLAEIGKGQVELSSGEAVAALLAPPSKTPNRSERRRQQKVARKKTR
jgi:hypothetical protein